MAQFFITTYRNDYRWHEMKGMRPLLKPKDRYSEGPPPGDIWIEPEILERSDGKEDTEKVLTAKKRVNRMLRNRLWTVYQVDYCKPDELKPESASGLSFDDVTVEKCRRLYSTEKTMKIPPPLPTFRRLFGYARPTKMYIPNTVYQEDIGKNGCNIIESNYKRIQAKDAQLLHNVYYTSSSSYVPK